MPQVLTNLSDLLDLGDDAGGKDIDNVGTVTAVAFVGDGSGITNVPGGSGTVTSVVLTLPNIFSVAGSPVTSSGTFIVSFTTQSANRIFAGPITGSAATPAFRALVKADIPALTTSDITESGNLYYTIARVNTDAPNVTIGTGSGLSLAGQVLSLSVASSGVAGALSGSDKTKLDGIASGATANAGTVTSVSLTLPSILSVTGSPVTSSGTFAVTLATQTANTIFAGPNASPSATPTFRLLGNTDLPKPIAPAPVSLTDAVTVVTDTSLGNFFRVTLGGNRTLGNPTNALDGQRITWELIQDGIGTRTLTLDTKFKFGTDITAAVLSTAANAVDYLTVIYNQAADKFRVVSFVRGY